MQLMNLRSLCVKYKSSSWLLVLTVKEPTTWKIRMLVDYGIADTESFVNSFWMLN